MLFFSYVFLSTILKLLKQLNPPLLETTKNKYDIKLLFQDNPFRLEIAKLLFADWNVIVSPFVIVLLSLADATVKLVAFAPALIPSNFVLSVFVKLFCVNPPSPTVYSVLTELTWIVFPVLVTVVAPSCWKSITSPELINVPVSPPDCSEALIVNPL